MDDRNEEKEFNIDKEKDFSEWYNELLWRADFIDQRYNVKGFLVHRPNATIVENIIDEMFEKELQRTGHKPMKFPALVPAENFEKESEHVQGFAPEVFWVTEAGNDKLEKRLALRPTSETIMYSMYSQWIRSHRDLPLKAYQRCQVWRYETKHTRPLLRCREFYWIEAHDVFRTKAEAERQVIEDMETCEKVLRNRMGIPFMYFKRPSWDKFAGAVYTFGADTLIASGRVLQLPSTHFLGQHFSKMFGITFTDEDENKHHAWQTCFGPSSDRMLAAMISVHGDNKGCKFPFEFAPVQVVIVPILKSEADKEGIMRKCMQLHLKLKQDYRAELDDSDRKPGAKYYHWEMRGTPVRVEIGARELKDGTVTVSRRDTGKRETLADAELGAYLKAAPAEMLAALREKAEKEFQSKIYAAETMDELREKIGRNGLVKIPFCSRDEAGRECADKVKEETGADIRGNLHGRDEAARGKCIACNKAATVMLYVAKSY